MALLLSLSILEYYGAYLSWWILRSELDFTFSSPIFSRAFADQALDVLSNAVVQGGLSIAGVGMLAISTAALPLGLFAYHLYLIWAGTTTNESQKWSDWKEDMADGFVFIASRAEVRRMSDIRSVYKASNLVAKADIAGILGLDGDDKEEPFVRWPVESDQILVRTRDGMPPTGQEQIWKRERNLATIDNIYDLGWLANFIEMASGR